MEKVTLIITVKNEANNISELLHSIEAQSTLPDEVVIADGGSTDTTLQILHSWKPNFRVKILKKPGNRSIGRNAAINAASHPLIAITDAGCVLDKSWLTELLKAFAPTVEVVAGYYKALANTSFERAAAAYMLVMPEHINAQEFLPATRSMALRKKTWEKIGKFDERYTFNEDYVFAKKLKKQQVQMAFAEKAIVFWHPPTTWNAFFLQVYKFAYGDAYAGILRSKVVLIFARYLIFLLLSVVPFVFWPVIAAYFIWAVVKSYKHVGSIDAILLLPIMQVGTDLTVMAGTLLGGAQRITHAG
ncbi:MAG TPA: glycosyltransferase [Candidatus Saccharimonadia bacterium]|nr:glycosyltransferase [Candidatus Saccharimonadia bacterium]